MEMCQVGRGCSRGPQGRGGVGRPGLAAGLIDIALVHRERVAGFGRRGVNYFGPGEDSIFQAATDRRDRGHPRRPLRGTGVLRRQGRRPARLGCPRAAGVRRRASAGGAAHRELAAGCRRARELPARALAQAAFAALVLPCFLTASFASRRPNLLLSSARCEFGESCLRCLTITSIRSPSAS